MVLIQSVAGTSTDARTCMFLQMRRTLRYEGNHFRNCFLVGDAQVHSINSPHKRVNGAESRSVSDKHTYTCICTYLQTDLC